MPLTFNPFTGNIDFLGPEQDQTLPVYIDVKNTYASTIPAGTPVYVTGSVGSTDILEIAPSDSAVLSKCPTIGLTVTSLAHNEFGLVIMFGELTGVNTNAFLVNDEVFVANGGGLTNSKPNTGYIQSIAVITRKNANNGSMLVWTAGRMDAAPGIPGQILCNKNGLISASTTTWDPTNGTSHILPFGYGAGSGGTITQSTDKTSTVILNAVCGTIITHSSTINANTAVSFTLTNNKIDTNDVIIINHAAGGTFGAYSIDARSANHSALISIRNLTGTNLSEFITIRFAAIKASIS